MHKSLKTSFPYFPCTLLPRQSRSIHFTKTRRERFSRHFNVNTTTAMLTSTVSPLLKLGLCLIGMWPDFSYRTFFWFFYMATLVIMQYFQYSYFFAQLGTNDFSKLMDGLSITLDYTLTFLKLLSLWHNRR